LHGGHRTAPIKDLLYYITVEIECPLVFGIIQWMEIEISEKILRVAFLD